MLVQKKIKKPNNKVRNGGLLVGGLLLGGYIGKKIMTSEYVTNKIKDNPILAKWIFEKKPKHIPTYPEEKQKTWLNNFNSQAILEQQNFGYAKPHDFFAGPGGPMPFRGQIQHSYSF